jgi:CubicO group peptidase (beta-lactamase class C family)
MPRADFLRLRGNIRRAIVASLLLASPARAVEPDLFLSPATAPPALEKRLRQILNENSTPGLSVVLLKGQGAAWSAGIGLADVAEGRPATPTTLFRIGSVSKMFVALSVLKLVEEGKLSLETPVRSLVPEISFTNRWEATDPVRVVHLLEHTTGWDDGQVKALAEVGPDPVTPAEGLALVWASRVSRWRPGTYFAYCNAGPTVAAAIIEKLTGKRFEDYVKETFFDRLGMSTADYFDSPRIRALLTKLYHSDGRTPVPYWHSARSC